MSFTEAITHVFSNYASFNGRARRSEYWYFVLFVILVNIVLSILANMRGIGSVAGACSGIFGLAIFIPSLAVAVRRLHDIGKSGWWLLLGLIPIIGAVVLIFWYCQDSFPETNQYGICPKTGEIV